MFVRAALGDDPLDPSRLSSADVVGFVVAMQARFSPCSMKAVRTALRSFFRFLRFEGLCDERLELAVPRVAHWRLSTLPRYLSDGQLARLLASLAGSGRAGGGIARSCRVWRAWGCGRAMSQTSASRTSTGGAAAPGCGERKTRKARWSRYRALRAGRSSPTCARSAQ
jgi:hypothetical protein